MEDLIRDVRVAFRGLMRSRGLALVAIVTLAVAIGATTSIFSVVDGVLLRPLPYPDADRIVRVGALTLPDQGGGEAPFSDRGYWHFHDQNRVYEAFGGFSAGTQQAPLTGDGPPLQVNVALVTASAFDVIGVPPMRGRLPTAEEDAPGGAPVVLVSHALWVDRYGADPGLVGRMLDINGTGREVIGIMPPGYDFPNGEIDVWAPRQLDPASENFGGHHIFGVARLAEGITVEAATGDAEALIGRFDELGYTQQWFQTIFSGEATVRTLKEDIVGDSRQPLIILLGTVGFVLLIACSNVANLLLVRAETRTRERAVRMALGSGRGRLVRHVVTESVLLGLIGGALGTVLAFVGTRILVAFGPASVPRLDQIGMNGTVLAFTLLVSVGAGLLFGAFPAVRVGSRKAVTALRDGGRGSTIGADRHRARSVLVVGQVALALMLLVGSGLMVRSFQELRSVDPGFDAEGVLTFRVSTSPAEYPDAEASARFFDELRGALLDLNGVEEVGGINTLPLSGGGAVLTAQIDEFPTPEDEFPPVFLARRATPGYFAAMGVPVIEGREFTADDHLARTGAIIISASVKQEFWPTESALGKRITHQGAPARVVGVVGDLHDTGLDVDAELFGYKPMLDSVGGAVRPMTMVVRTAGDPTDLVPAVRSTIERLDPLMPLTDVRPLSSYVDQSLSRTTFTMSLLLLAAVVALFLGSVGIYGVLAYVASQRTAEMGIRLALGADGGTIRTIILKQGLGLAAVGVAVGLVGAFLLRDALDSLLFGVSALDPVTLAGVSLVFLGVAAVASLVPAIRASRTPPAIALRAD